VVAFRRISPSTGNEIIFAGNFSPVVREGHRLGLPRPGSYKQILNTDNQKYCGSGVGIVPGIKAEKIPWHGLDYSAEITLPPLATLWFEAAKTGSG
jgi:1,4-alpha-glucan branching enzyme